MKKTLVFAAIAAMLLVVSCKEDDSAVDLGLSVKWATCNVGSETPEGIGEWFAWGETEGKDKYLSGEVKYCNEDIFTKYNTSDGLVVLEAADDPATVALGDKWRTPTQAEFKELIENCEYEWTELNGIEGCKFTANNGNSVFFPAINSFTFGEKMYGSSVELMTSTREGEYDDSAVWFSGRKKRPDCDMHSCRYIGFQCRPVKVK